MSKQYRIKQDGIQFIPQVRNFLFWRDIKVYDSSRMEYSTERVIDSIFKRCMPNGYSYGMVSLKKNHICFSSLETAEKFINEYGRVNNVFEYKGHKIIKTYSRHFVDVSCNKFFGEWGNTYYSNYSRSIEDIEVIIDEFEAKWAESKVRKIYKV
jgi:hypothetical protein